MLLQGRREQQECASVWGGDMELCVGVVCGVYLHVRL